MRDDLSSSLPSALILYPSKLSTLKLCIFPESTFLADILAALQLRDASTEGVYFIDGKPYHVPTCGTQVQNSFQLS